MKYNFFGNTGMAVSELCFGTMTFGGNGYWANIGNQDQAEADALLKLVPQQVNNAIARIEEGEIRLAELLAVIEEKLAS